MMEGERIKEKDKNKLSKPNPSTSIRHYENLYAKENDKEKRERRKERERKVEGKI